MGDFFNDTMQGLLEAVEIEKGNINLCEKEDMPAPTFTAADKEKELIDEVVRIRKMQNISQSQMAELTGSKQQAISRTEKKEHSPSLKLFYSMVNALGYDIKIVKK
jgi:DNA-binding XRE family transcriptional regulator